MFITWNLIGVAVVAIYLFLRYEVTNIKSLKTPFDTKDLIVAFLAIPLIPVGFIIFGTMLALCCLIRYYWRKILGKRNKRTERH